MGVQIEWGSQKDYTSKVNNYEIIILRGEGGIEKNITLDSRGLHPLNPIKNTLKMDYIIVECSLYMHGLFAANLRNFI